MGKKVLPSHFLKKNSHRHQPRRPDHQAKFQPGHLRPQHVAGGRGACKLDWQEGAGGEVPLPITLVVVVDVDVDVDVGAHDEEEQEERYLSALLLFLLMLILMLITGL